MASLDKKAIAQAYESGGSITEIAEKFGCSRGGVQGIIARSGVVVRGKGWDYDRFPVVGRPGDQIYRQGRCRRCDVACFGIVKLGANPVARDICGECE